MAFIADITADDDVQRRLLGVDLAQLGDVAAWVGAALFGASAHEVSIRLVTDATIGALHGEWFDDPAPTDVITFPAHNELGSADDPFLGDIVVSVETALVAAAEEGWPLGRELAFIVIHGLLHIAGWDDATPERRGAMLAEGERLLAAFEAERGKA